VRAVFLGTPPAAVPSLAATADIADVDMVITRPDKPKGRGARTAPSAVKEAAASWGFRVEQPATSADLEGLLAPLDVDLAVVVAYGRILKPEVLALARFGFVNIHFSLLPRWRGAAPVERAILAGDPVTGVSLMQLDEGLDTGPVISVIETPISNDETGGSLTARLSYLGASLLDDSLPGFLNGQLQPAQQLDAGATEAARLQKAEAEITAATDPAQALRMVRAFHPRPGAWCRTLDGRLKVVAARPGRSLLPRGRIEMVEGTPHLGLGGGTITLDVVQPEGKRPQPGSAWMNGRRGAPTELAGVAGGEPAS
jgi:methionyl-tRNA formyltransferase